ncbi:MAG: Nramp family divalent metal transporter [Candidatus Paceibacterota bacterium]|jgi:NRAMP (natural resistance-associated macrophage protein)-like metal ion transporter
MKKGILEKLFSAPAEILEKSVEVGRGIETGIANEKPVKAAIDYWKKLGPGLITGAADDDPSGIATYSQMGASQGFGLIWLSLFSFPLMATIQEMCARIGLATGVGLAANIRKYYSKKLLYLCTALLLFANVFNIGADLGAMAKGTQLIFPALNFIFLIFIFAIVSLFLQIFISYKKYAKYLKYLTFVLFAYVISAFSVKINWGEVFQNTVIPSFHFSKDIIILITAALGTTISPYLFFWQSSQEVEEQILHGEKTEAIRRASTTGVDIKNMRIDVWSGMFVSNMIMFFIIAACAATLFSNGITNIATASDAALALRPFAGNFAFVLFALGILGTGLLAIPVLAGSASYAISESFGWKTGLYRKLKQATSFYGIIIIAMALGIILNFVGLDPIKALIYSAVLNGIISPFMIFFIVHLSGDESVMGNFKNKKTGNIFGWITFVLISLVSIGALISIFL